METSSSQSGALHDTCLGIPLTSERAINERERRFLHDEAKRSLWRAWGWGCGVPVAILVALDLIAALMMASEKFTAFPSVLLALFSMAALALPAVFILRANDQYRRRKAAKQDLDKSLVKIYHGLPPGFMVRGEAAKQTRPTKIGGVLVSLHQPMHLEVFSASRRLWQVNDSKTTKLTFLPEEYTAPQPEQALTVAKWVEPAQRLADNTLDDTQSGRRQLSDAEKVEIRQRSRTIWRKPAFGAVVFTVVFLFPLVYAVASGAPLQMDFGNYLFLAITLWIDFMFIKAILQAQLLIKDASGSDVMITRLPDQKEEEKIQVKGRLIEWLPISRHTWSIDGQPAPWRLQR